MNASQCEDPNGMFQCENPNAIVPILLYITVHVSPPSSKNGRASTSFARYLFCLILKNDNQFI